MKIEYIGEILPDGHISVDPSILSKFDKGQKVRVTIVPLSDKTGEIAGRNRRKDEATKRFISRLENAARLGKISGELNREEIYEDMTNEKF